MPEVEVYIFFSSFASEKQKNKRKPRRDLRGRDVRALPALLPGSEGRAKAESRAGENSSRTRRNKYGTRGVVELVPTPNPITGLVTPAHLLSLPSVVHGKSTGSDDSPVIARCTGNPALLAPNPASDTCLVTGFPREVLGEPNHRSQRIKQGEGCRRGWTDGPGGQMDGQQLSRLTQPLNDQTRG